MVDDSKNVQIVGHLTAMLRSLVIERAGRAGNQEIISEAQIRFNAHCSGECLLPADLRNAVRLHLDIFRFIDLI